MLWTLSGSTCYPRDNSRQGCSGHCPVTFWKFSTMEIAQPVWKSVAGSDQPHYEDFCLISNPSSHYCSLCPLPLMFFLVHLQEVSCFVFLLTNHYIVEDSNCLLEPSSNLSFCIVKLLPLHHFSLLFQRTPGFVLDPSEAKGT